MATKGIDCATPLTAKTAQALAKLGIQFVCRYLVPEKYAWKRLTRTEAEAVTASGMQMVSVYETTANRASGGAAAGGPDGVAALAEAKLISQPLGSAIYFAVDYDAQAKDYDAIERYLKAAAAEIPEYNIGVYGSYAVIEEMAKRGAAKHFWQTYAWSGGKKSKLANIYQYQNATTLAGLGVDLDESYGSEGWWSTKEEPKAFTAEVIDRNGVAHPVPDEAVRLENGVTWIIARTFTDLVGGTVVYNKAQNKSTFDFSKVDIF